MSEPGTNGDAVGYAAMKTFLMGFWAACLLAWIVVFLTFVGAIYLSLLIRAAEAGWSVIM